MFEDLITAQERHYLIELFTQELTKLNNNVPLRYDGTLIIERGDEGEIAAAHNDITKNTTILEERRRKFMRLITMIDELPKWDGFCPQCHEPVPYDRIAGAASMLCLACQITVELKEKRTSGGHRERIS